MVDTHVEEILLHPKRFNPHTKKWEKLPPMTEEQLKYFDLGGAIPAEDIARGINKNSVI